DTHTFIAPALSLLMLVSERVGTPLPYTTLFRSGGTAGTGAEVRPCLVRRHPDVLRGGAPARVGQQPARSGHRAAGAAGGRRAGEIGRAHVWTPVTCRARMPSSACKNKTLMLRHP